MSIKRLGLSNPAANINTTIAIVTEPHLASVIATNKSDTGPALITIWVVPVGATQESQYSYITYNLELSEGNSFETHRFAMNQSDTLRVKSSTGEVSFIASGVPQTATPSTDSSQIFTNKTISGLTNTITDIGNSSLVNDSITLMGEEMELGESVSNLDYFQFDTAATPTAAVGRMIWDDGDGTVSLGLKGGNVNIQLGQEEVALCYNGTGATLTEGTVVYVVGAQGQRPRIAKASASSESTSSKTFGVVTENIANGEEGFVATFGIVRGLNTLAFAEGSALWLSTTSGLITSTMPTAPNHAVFIGYCIRSHQSAGEIFIKIQNGYELQELHNVLITDPANGQGLVYESSTGLWKNQNVDALPSQSGNSGKYLTTNGTVASWGTVDLSSYATQSYVDTSVSNLIDAAPSTLNTLNELAAALNDDASFSTTVTNALSNRVLTTGGSTITVSTGTDVPLTIQNNGSGNSFIVNDAATDTTPFVITASGDIGVGVSSPSYKLDVSGTINATAIYLNGSPFRGGATGGSTDAVFYENDQVITTSYTITTGKNAMSAGPITINDGVTVTIPNNSVWTVV